MKDKEEYLNVLGFQDRILRSNYWWYVWWRGVLGLMVILMILMLIWPFVLSIVQQGKVQFRFYSNLYTTMLASFVNAVTGDEGGKIAKEGCQSEVFWRVHLIICWRRWQCGSSLAIWYESFHLSYNPLWSFPLLVGIIESVCVRGLISFSEESKGMAEIKEGSTSESCCTGLVIVCGLRSVFLQLLDVWPEELHKKHVILPSVKKTLNSVWFWSKGSDPENLDASSYLINSWWLMLIPPLRWVI